MPESDNEVGRALSITDLKPGQVVVIAPPQRDILITMWVEFVDETSVSFYSGQFKWHVVNTIKDGRIVDDQDRVVKVFEYLGAV